MTKPDGWVVLNADDPLVAAVARRVRAASRSSRCERRAARPVVRAPSRAGRPGVPASATGSSSRRRATTSTPIVDVAEVPIAIGGLARHNVANALAAAGGARGLGATIEQVARRPARLPARSSERSPGRLNLFRARRRVVIVDFAHNEAGIGGGPRRRRGHRGGCGGRAAPITAIIGTAGDRPDDTLRGIGRIAAQRAQRVAIKETLKYLRGRTARIGRRRAARGSRRRRRLPRLDVPVYETETEALQAELTWDGRGADGRTARCAAGDRADVPRGARRRSSSCIERLGGPAGRRRLGADRARAAAPGPAAARVRRAGLVAEWLCAAGSRATASSRATRRPQFVAERTSGARSQPVGSMADRATTSSSISPALSAFNCRIRASGQHAAISDAAARRGAVASREVRRPAGLSPRAPRARPDRRTPSRRRVPAAAIASR